ncbi:sulfatase-like hydrolase/transferase [Singulisphaera sp. PoT]|uniref:sulfatase-like hydrolase/transferase n=1 Tax=Singulisphaera sp. PoT TaxID=3411797 RepID=UPI003BF5B700
MRHRLAFAAALIGLAQASTLALGAGDEPRPNLLFLYADDLGFADVGFNGRTEWSTPNIDRLGAQGTIFKRFYTAAVICAPSRAALLTGKYTIHNGVARNDDDLPSKEVTIAEALKANGYVTGVFGKWHHGQPRPGEASYVHPMDQGFDEFFGFTDAKHAWEKFPEELWHGRELKPVSGHSDDLFADRTIDFIKRHKGERFFAYVPFINSHFNIEAPADEIELHKGKFPELDPERPLRATYAAMVTRLDKNIGRILAALDEQGLAENTLVVFASDHGATFEAGNLGTSSFHDSNKPFRGQKRTLWEGGLRVPALARWPGHIPNGKVSNEVMHMTDVFPTLLAAAGGTPDPAWHVDGISLLPAWIGQGKVPDRTLFWEWRSEGSNQVAAMRGNHKVVITGNGRAEFFDVENDPAERRNTFAESPELARDLQKALKEWLATEIRDESAKATR